MVLVGAALVASPHSLAIAADDVGALKPEECRVYEVAIKWLVTPQSNGRYPVVSAVSPGDDGGDQVASEHTKKYGLVEDVPGVALKASRKPGDLKACRNIRGQIETISPFDYKFDRVVFGQRMKIAVVNWDRPDSFGSLMMRRQGDAWIVSGNVRAIVDPDFKIYDAPSPLPPPNFAPSVPNP